MIVIELENKGFTNIKLVELEVDNKAPDKTELGKVEYV